MIGEPKSVGDQIQDPTKAEDDNDSLPSKEQVTKWKARLEYKKWKELPWNDEDAEMSDQIKRYYAALEKGATEETAPVIENAVLSQEKSVAIEEENIQEQLLQEQSFLGSGTEKFVAAIRDKNFFGIISIPPFGTSIHDEIIQNLKRAKTALENNTRLSGYIVNTELKYEGREKQIAYVQAQIEKFRKYLEYVEQFKPEDKRE